MEHGDTLTFSTHGMSRFCGRSWSERADRSAIGYSAGFRPGDSWPDRELSPRLLVVEDDPATLLTMARLLRMDGYLVSLAATVNEALRLSESHRFDLVISDVGLPDGSGCDLLGRLQHIRPVRAIALTGFDDEQRLACCREAGFLEQLVKPIDFGHLEEIIRRMTASPALS